MFANYGKLLYSKNIKGTAFRSFAAQLESQLHDPVSIAEHQYESDHIRSLKMLSFTENCHQNEITSYLSHLNCLRILTTCLCCRHLLNGYQFDLSAKLFIVARS